MLEGGSVVAPSSNCLYSCGGNSAEICGGDYRFNLYEFGLTPATPSVTSTTSSVASSSSSTSTTVVASPTAPAGYLNKGCYTEATNQRALTGNSYFDDAMTVAKCAAACPGFHLFGVEYGPEVCQLLHHVLI
jgi:hypothetical protein